MSDQHTSLSVGRSGEDVPLVPAIWPLGLGCVMTSYAMAENVPMFVFRAVRDDQVGTPGDAASFDTWDACAEAPTLTLAFADVAAIERLASSLSELAEAVKAQATNNTISEETGR